MIIFGVPGQVFKNTQMSNFMKVSLVEAEFFHSDRKRDGRMDRQTEIIQIIVAFRNFSKSPKKVL